MEFFDYDIGNEEYDRLLKEADPCTECGETETLALAAITSESQFGTLLIFCTDCHINKEEADFSVEKEEKTLYA